MTDVKKYEVKVPHGNNFQLVDTVDVIHNHPTSDATICHYTYYGKEIWKAEDHFPGNPIMPGVMILEAIAQSAIQIAQTKPELDGKNFVLTSATISWPKMVKPGTTLILESTIEWIEENRRGCIHGAAKVGNEVYASAVINFAVVKNRATRQKNA